MSCCLNLNTLELQINECPPSSRLVDIKEDPEYDPPPAASEPALVEQCVAGAGIRDYVSPAYKDIPEDVKLYYCVLAFPEGSKHRLKVKNKMKISKYEDFTMQQQMVLFKRKLEEWREIFEYKCVVIPEFTRSNNLHFNIIYASRMMIKDQRIIFNDAYNMTRNVNALKHFCHIQEVYEYNHLYEKYLVNKDGHKKAQRTNVQWDFYNN